MGVNGDRVRLKRAYEPASPDDGTRVLVERLWAAGGEQGRGGARRLGEGGRTEPGAQDVVRARGGALAGVPARLPGRARRARAAVAALRERAKAGRLTLVFAAHDAGHSSAAVLRDVLVGGGPADHPPAAA